MDPIPHGIDIDVGCYVVDHHSIYEAASYALIPARSNRVTTWYDPGRHWMKREVVVR